MRLPGVVTRQGAAGGRWRVFLKKDFVYRGAAFHILICFVYLRHEIFKELLYE
jgi:hypothetical protein